MYEDSRENLLEILAVVIVWSPISSVCELGYRIWDGIISSLLQGSFAKETYDFGSRNYLKSDDSYMNESRDIYSCIKWIIRICLVLSGTWRNDATRATNFKPLQITATHCNKLQHIAWHCSTLQHLPFYMFLSLRAHRVARAKRIFCAQVARRDSARESLAQSWSQVTSRSVYARIESLSHCNAL